MNALTQADTESIDGYGGTFLRGHIVAGDQQWLIPEALKTNAPQSVHATDHEVDGAAGYARAVTNVLHMHRMLQRADPFPAFRPMGQSLPGDDQLPTQLQPLWLERRQRPAPTLSLQPLQEWEGYVTAISAETFTARLVDITANQKLEKETADFPISDLSEDNLALLKEGAIFRWVIGYQRAPGGTKRRVSDITFRRLPAWTRRDLEQARVQAAQIVDDIAWE